MSEADEYVSVAQFEKGNGPEEYEKVEQVYDKIGDDHRVVNVIGTDIYDIERVADDEDTGRWRHMARFVDGGDAGHFNAETLADDLEDDNLRVIRDYDHSEWTLERFVEADS